MPLARPAVARTIRTGSGRLNHHSLQLEHITVAVGDGPLSSVWVPAGTLHSLDLVLESERGVLEDQLPSIWRNENLASVTLAFAA